MKDYLGEGNWAPDVRDALNRLIDEYRATEPDAPHRYVVFDFDNTVSVYDAEEQTCWYQLWHMAFAMTPDELCAAMVDTAPNDNFRIQAFGVEAPIFWWMQDIVNAYSAVWKDLGPFTASDLSEEKLQQLYDHPEWRDFCSKMGIYYELLNAHRGAAVSDHWMLHWFLGMTPDELYRLARRALRCQSQCPTNRHHMGGCKEYNYRNHLGARKTEFQFGISVPDEMRALFKALHDNGIDVWICSASHIDVIRGAIDEFGLHDSVTGLLGMTPKLCDGRMSIRYDYDTGFAAFPLPDGGWTRGNVPTRTMTDMDGKVTAIQNVLMPKYHSGPIAGFMDSGGDFSFCTAFASMRVCVCFRRLLYSCVNGGGLINFAGCHQRETLQMTYEQARESGDTLYVVQGRNEFDRCLIPENKSWWNVILERDLHCIEDGDTIMEQIKTNTAMRDIARDRRMTTEEILRCFSVMTGPNDEDNLIPGHAYGFLSFFRGYHNIRDGAD